MTRRRVHLIWFLHQPYFIPDDEILWRVDSTYLPLLDAIDDRSIRCSLGITAALLQRCATLRPDFIEMLSKAVTKGTIVLLGTAAYHPILPWLPTRSARAHIYIDQMVKAELGLQTERVFWPTELAWSTRVGALAVDFKYEAVVVDSYARDAADITPQWQSGPQGLLPIVAIEPRPGSSSKITTTITDGTKQQPLTLWVRERSLSNAFLEAMVSEEEDERQHLVRFITALDAARARAMDSKAPVILADDAERFLPNGLARFLGLLDSALEASIDFVSPQEFMSLPSVTHVSYVPGATMEGPEDMWSTTVDDVWFRRHLDRVTELVQARCDLLSPRTAEEHKYCGKLLRIQDSSFYVWHYIARARRSFYTDLLAIERWLDSR